MSISDSFRSRISLGIWWLVYVQIYNSFQGDYMNVELLLILELLQTNELGVEEE